MTLKEKTITDLQRYYRFKNYVIPNLSNKIKLIDYELEGVGAIEYSDMPTGTGGKKTSYKREKLIDKKTKVKFDLVEKKAFVEYIDKALKSLGEDEEIIIECFAKNKRDKLREHEICKKLNISKTSLYRKRKELLEELIENLYGF